MTDSPSPPTMHFAYTATAPPLEDLSVKQAVPGTLFDAPAVFLVIGNSHCVLAPALQFAELCSCLPPDAEVSASINLDERINRQVTFTTPGVTGTTRIETQPLEAFPGPAEQDIAYRFGVDAYTTISVQSAGYETYHTYPEHDKIVYTHTAVERRRTDGVGVEPSPESPVTLPTNADFHKNG
ncbi:DUF2617 family protein [Salinibaculum rarum]|uniref:DUF2617 family protein n=1 Tax=Salinibaculum rarum TaxID=3058903 RepID=UPI00265ECF35|nr:DUF2617 family protein [Salinibaculum sp. KK48]